MKGWKKSLDEKAEKYKIYIINVVKRGGWYNP
jgi:hypothetical protein